MPKLFEFQGKKILKENGVVIPDGKVATALDEVEKIVEGMSKPVVLKAQVWSTSRAAVGGIMFAETPSEAGEAAASMLGKKFKNFSVDKILVEEKLNIEKEFYGGLIVDDAARGPVIIFSSQGGSGLEDIAKETPEKISSMAISVGDGLRLYQACNIIRKTGVKGKLMIKLAKVLVSLANVAINYECRSMEINPLVLTKEGQIVAVDCRMTVDDKAVFRHPELGIDIARELDRPATELERIAYKVEESDYRGTFYFLQMEDDPQGDNYIGFHGGGGGGSMMAMDALTRQGFKVPNFCDTSGNPPASKVYRAAKIIMSQNNLQGYFHSGSGVANQEQFHTARGLVKAFRELNLSIPAVIRIGGNSEEEAIKILQEFTADLPGKVEAYGRDTSVDFCVNRLKELVGEARGGSAE